MAFEKIEKDGYVLYRNEGGKEIASAGKGVVIADGYAFRDLFGQGKLLPYIQMNDSVRRRTCDQVRRF